MKSSLVKRGLLALVLLLGMTEGVLKAKTTAAKMVNYTHKTEGFSVMIPAKWEIQEDVVYQVYKIPVIAIRPQAKNNAFRENLNVTIDKIPPGTETQEYLDANLEQMGKGLGEFKAIEKGDLKKGFTDAKYLVYSHREKADDVVMKVVVFIYVLGDKGYCLTCTASVDSYKNYQDLFFEIGKSFKPPKG
jgi:hypothetical protein